LDQGRRDSHIGSNPVFYVAINSLTDLFVPHAKPIKTTTFNDYKLLEWPMELCAQSLLNANQICGGHTYELVGGPNLESYPASYVQLD